MFTKLIFLIWSVLKTKAGNDYYFIGFGIRINVEEINFLSVLKFNRRIRMLNSLKYSSKKYFVKIENWETFFMNELVPIEKLWKFFFVCDQDISSHEVKKRKNGKEQII